MTTDRFVVTEGVLGYWHYHISKASNETEALCGALTMATLMPLDLWGTESTHFPIKEKYCKQCEEAYEKTKGE